MSAYSYEEICSFIGHLYLTSQANSKRLEDECQRLFLSNQELQKQISVLGQQDNGLQSERASS